MNRRIFTGVLSCAACLWAPAAITQSTTGSDKVPLFTTNARDVVVDVVVTKANNSAKGLHASDFKILEDGKLQTIDYFEEHLARALPPGAVTPLPKMPPGVFTNVPPAPANGAVNVLLLDSLNTEPADQVNVRRQLFQFIEKMRPGTRVAIFALGSKLHFIQGFTSDTSALVAALKDKKLDSGPERNPNFQTRSDTADNKESMAILQSMLMGHSDAGIEAFQGALRDMADMSFTNRTAITLDALQFLARYLANVPGRKNLIWFAGSFPVNIFPTPGQLQDISNQRLYLSQIKETADLLTVSRVAVYPIGAEGVMQDYTMAADNNLDVSGRGASMMGNLSGEAGDRAANIFNMEQLAEETGGRAFYNTNDLTAAVQGALDNGSNYYTLVYSPTNKKMDGKFRKIEIKANSSGYKLAYRHGYNADNTPPGVQKQSPGPLRSLMVLGLPNSTQILYGLRVIPEVPQPAGNAPRAGKNDKLAGPTTRYSVDFLVRWTDVRMEELTNGQHTAKLQFELFAYDMDDHPVNWTGGIEEMALTPDLYKAVQKSGVPGHFEIDLPAGKNFFLQTGVFDWGTRKAGTLEVAMRPDELPTATATANPPVGTSIQGPTQAKP